MSLRHSSINHRIVLPFNCCGLLQTYEVVDLEINRKNCLLIILMEDIDNVLHYAKNVHRTSLLAFSVFTLTICHG